MIVSGVFAITTQNTTAVFNTGLVDIKLQIYKLNEENEEVEYENSDLFVPGKVTSFIPKIIKQDILLITEQ